MKRILSTFVVCLMIVGCNNNNSKKTTVTFAPQDRTTSLLSDAEREDAIAKKRASSCIDVDVLLDNQNVKLSVIAPAPDTNLTPENSQLIAMKMLNLISKNGIGGLNNVPGFALCANFTPVSKKVTSTIPQKMMVTYALDLRVLNVTTDDTYSTARIPLKGVGGSFEEATINAINSFESTGDLQKMLSESSDKIISWYNDNLHIFKNQVETAKAKAEYALALALVESVPAQASSAFAYATSEHVGILESFKKSIIHDELSAIRAIISQSTQELNSDVYAHLKMLPQTSEEYSVAEDMIKSYERDVLLAKKKQVEAEQALEEMRLEKEKAIRLAEIEEEKLKAKYQSKATEKAIRAQGYAQKGFWSSLGEKVLTGLDFIGDTIDESLNN